MLKPEDYLICGEKTELGENVKRLASCVNGNDSVDTIKRIMYLMSQKIPMERSSDSSQKFKRSAEEIIQDKARNGCCDSSTLFVALCRAKGIPAVQIITAYLPALKRKDFSKGHFFSGCYLRESNSWVWLDSDKKIDSMDDVVLHPLDTSRECIDKNYYAFAYARDYSEFEINGVRIDSIHNMNEIHRKIGQEYFDEERQK